MYNEKRLLENYYDMLRIKSVTGNEKDMAVYVDKKIKEMGLDTKWYYHDGPESPSLYTVFEGEKEGPTLLLIGHLDTVDVYEGWKTDPFEPVTEGNKVYARGAMDMKGGISSILEVLRVLVDKKADLRGNIIAAFVADEEYLSRGTYTLLKNGLKADMAIMAECRFNEIAIGFRGRYSIIVDVYGETAHSSKYPELGESAIINGIKIAEKIEDLPTKSHPKLGKGSWCIRSIKGGTKTTLNVPEKCELFIDRYLVPGEDYETCERQILDLAKELGLENKVKVYLAPRDGTPYMEPFAIPEEHELVTTIRKKYKNIVGKELPLGYDPSVCDSNYLYQIGKILPVTFGPSGENMHKANEYGYIDQIKDCTQIYLETIEELML